jgi:hypothetical protein
MTSDDNTKDKAPTIPDDSIPWEEVEDAARSIFSVWAFGSELEWARECWGHFQRAGLASYEGELETTAAYLRLVTLGSAYREFCAIMWDEDTTDIPLTHLSEGLPINPIALGLLAARDLDGDFEGACDEQALEARSLASAISLLLPEVYGCLTEAYGDEVQLYSRMARTQTSGDDEDEERDDSNDNDEIFFHPSIFEPTGRNSSALSFVSNGFQNG